MAVRAACFVSLLIFGCQAVSDELEITKSGKVFSTAAKSTLFPKDLEQFKSKAVADAWGDWRPKDGMKGKLLGLIAGGRLLMEVEGKHILISEAGVAGPGVEKIAQIKESQKPSGFAKFFAQQEAMVNKFIAEAPQIMEEVEKLWEKDEFPVMGYTLKFSHVVLGYAALLLFAISTTACFGCRTNKPDMDAIKNEMIKVYKKHKPENVSKIDEIIKLWEGREDEIVPTLHAKYIHSAPTTEDKDKTAGEGEKNADGDDQKKTK